MTRSADKVKAKQKPTFEIVAADHFDTFNRKTCEACGHLIRMGQRIHRWMDGIITHEECGPRMGKS